MTEAERTHSTLEDIDARQDEVLERLEALNSRVERLLSDWRPDRAASKTAPAKEQESSDPAETPSNDRRAA